MQRRRSDPDSTFVRFHERAKFLLALESPKSEVLLIAEMERVSDGFKRLTKPKTTYHEFDRVAVSRQQLEQN
jgi:hypothetical protein